MSNDLMQQICYLAHIHALRAPEDLVNQIKWCYSEEHSQTLINLVHLHVPIPEPPHPPMIPQNHPTSTLTVSSQAPLGLLATSHIQSCGICHSTRHNREYCHHGSQLIYLHGINRSYLPTKARCDCQAEGRSRGGSTQICSPILRGGEA